MNRSMTILGLLLTLATSSACGGGDGTFETAMSFDQVNVAPFLYQLNGDLHLGLPVEDLAAFTAATPVETERSRTVSVTFHGTATRLEYSVFMDDVDAPDVSFITPSQDLSKAIDAEMKAFAGQRGM